MMTDDDIGDNGDNVYDYYDDNNGDAMRVS